MAASANKRTYYKRALPCPPAIPFSSAEGKPLNCPMFAVLKLWVHSVRGEQKGDLFLLQYTTFVMAALHRLSSRTDYIRGGPGSWDSGRLFQAH